MTFLGCTLIIIGILQFYLCFDHLMTVKEHEDIKPWMRWIMADGILPIYGSSKRLGKVYVGVISFVVMLTICGWGLVLMAQ